MNRNTSREHTLSPARPNRKQQWIVVATGGQEYILNNSLVLSATDIAHRIDLGQGTLLIREADSEQARSNSAPLPKKIATGPLPQITCVPSHAPITRPPC